MTIAQKVTFSFIDGIDFNVHLNNEAYTVSKAAKAKTNKKTSNKGGNVLII